jgi:hypothetical protein
MPLAARTKHTEQDYPKSVKESASTLPFKAGGTFTLAVAGTRQNLVFVDDLRRFENDIIAAGLKTRVDISDGTHTGGANEAVLTDAAASFIVEGVQVGDRVRNVTDGSSAIITARTATTITGVLGGGAENDWDPADAYTVEDLSQAVLTDSAASFILSGVEIGDRVNNTTDGSTALITAITATTITGVLAGGGSNDWVTGEAYTIEALGSHTNDRAEEIRKIRIATSLECHIKVDGDASAADHDFHLAAGESMSEDNVRIIARLSVINVVALQLPVLRWWVYGA